MQWNESLIFCPKTLGLELETLHGESDAVRLYCTLRPSRLEDQRPQDYLTVHEATIRGIPAGLNRVSGQSEGIPVCT